MQRWNWFLAADFQGKWIITNGYAEVTMEDRGVTATLRFAADGDVYHFVKATISKGVINAHITSPDSEVPAFNLTGSIYTGNNKESAETRTIILTDGSTVLGLTYGPRSDEDNL